MSAPAAPVSVLYRHWPFAAPPRLEFLSAGAEAVMEATAAEVAHMLATGTLPLCGVDSVAFYAGVERSNRDHAPWQCEFGYVGPRTGRVRWFQGADFPQTAADGTRYFLGTLLDVTARRDAEAAERAAAGRLAAHMANTPLAVVEWDPDLRVVRWTGAAETLFGWTAAEVVGRRLTDVPLVHPADAARVAGACDRLRAGHERRNVVFNRNRHKSGRVLACAWHNSTLLDATGKVASVLSLAQDRTPASEAEAAVRRSEERLRTALRHANMLGWEHDLVTDAVHYSGDRAAFFGGDDADDPGVNVVHPADRERVRESIDAAVRTGGPLAVEYRGVARTPDGRPRWFLARGQVEADPAGRPVRAVGVTAEITDRVQAADARAAVERALVAARRPAPPEVDVHAVNNHLAAALGQLQLAGGLLVGHPAGEAVRAAAAACGRTADVLRRPAPTPPPLPSGWRGEGRALVADDEVNIRELVAALLEEAGFSVTRAADGPAALAAFRADPGGFRLAVTDLLMPGLEGDALVGRLRADRPGLPVVLMTGFSTRAVDPAVLAAPATRLLQKPFRVEHLLAAARAVCGVTA